MQQRDVSYLADILAYDHVDPDEVWNAVKFAIPVLVKEIESLLPPEQL